MFKSLLVANRAEIACRIFRTARAMGLRCIGVHSEADAKAKHVREADESVLIGPAPAAASYLRGDKIIAAAKETGAEAIHPGYGFLSENPDFAQAVIDAGLVWVGPTPDSIRAMGLKDEAKRIAEEAGVPVAPGYRGEAQDAKTLLKEAKAVGFPVLIKAVAGGGGRGIREVRAAAEFNEALASAKREAAAAFGDDRVLIEKLVPRPRHIEVQVFGDKHGNLVHMFERDCSLQRRRQKVIEEAPAPGMSEEVRAAMTEAALRIARAVAYENAGTVEFIVDGAGPPRADGFWFLEMNTRLQVEHPVTEAVTGLDLVEWQLRIAAGEKLPLQQQADIKLTGHAIEARLVAENTREGFRPSVGRLRRFRSPTLVRVDCGYDEGDAVPGDYDSLLAKIISHSTECEDGWTPRTHASDMLQSSLDAVEIEGVEGNAGFLSRCLSNADFAAGRVHAGMIAEQLETLSDRSSERLAAAVFFALSQARASAANPWSATDGWRATGERRANWTVEVDHAVLEVALRSVAMDDDKWVAKVAGRELQISAYFEREHAERSALLDGEFFRARLLESGAGAVVFTRGERFALEHPGASREHGGAEAGDEIKAPLPGKVVAVQAKAGRAVKKGDALVTLEAMKMEHALKAPRDGAIAEVAVAAGAQVKEGALLVRLEAQAE